MLCTCECVLKDARIGQGKDVARLIVCTCVCVRVCVHR